jgi:hypothetical protein
MRLRNRPPDLPHLLNLRVERPTNYLLKLLSFLF